MMIAEKEVDTTYSYADALQASMDCNGGEELPAKVFLDKYALRNKFSQLVEETPRDMHLRIASEFARIESTKFSDPLSKDLIFELLDGFKYIIPQGSPMFAIGNRYQLASSSNCYVIAPPLDSYGSILKSDEELIQLCKRRGGVGTDLSNLRPAGRITSNSAGSSTGVVSFMSRYSNSIREVGQNGRRGALMLTLSVHHPEILDFVSVKLDKKKVTGANVSVRITNEFMQAVADDKEYNQRWPVNSKTPEVSKMVSAKEVWHKIVECAHSMGEPGILFWDNILNESPSDCYRDFGFETVSTNPCSEIPLSSYDSCRLMCLNVYSYVVNPFTQAAYFDYSKFRNHAAIMQRLMDDLVDLEYECIKKIMSKIERDPEPEEFKQTELNLWKKALISLTNGRRTGSGVTAIGDTLAALGIEYCSEASRLTIDSIYRTLKLACYRSSVDMAKELGPFPVWNSELEVNNPFIARIKTEDIELWKDMQKYGRRNIALLTTAPTGSVSILTQTTSGIEPLFSMSHIRRKKVNPMDQDARIDFVDETGDSWQNFEVYHAKIQEWMKISGCEDIKKSPWYGSCADDLQWKDRVALQATANKHIDHAISSTINLPEDVSVDAVKGIYELAWASGCKGMTVYRKNCRTGVLVDKDSDTSLIKKTKAPKRPKVLKCDIFHNKMSESTCHVVVGLLGGDPYEVFAGKNLNIPHDSKSGVIVKEGRGRYELMVNEGCIICDVREAIEPQEEAITRLVSTSLRHGADIEFIVHQLEKGRGGMATFEKILARSLKKYIKNGSVVSGAVCPSCNAETLVRMEGCQTCTSCSWSKCS